MTLDIRLKPQKGYKIFHLFDINMYGYKSKSISVILDKIKQPKCFHLGCLCLFVSLL